MKRNFIILILFLFPKVCFGALDAAITWEIQTTGESSAATMYNGGGFKAGAAGTDYSQGGSLPANGAPHLAFTDLETKNNDYDRVYSATENANMVAGCIGNVIHIISGTNFTAGWYEVTGNGDGGGDGLYLDIDRDCASANSNDATANLGGCLALGVGAVKLDDDFFEALTAGNIVYISGGGAGNTHSPGESISVSKAGTSTATLICEGYDSSRGDNPTGTDRPLISAGAWTFSFGLNWVVKNLRKTGTSATGVAAGTSVQNCYVYNSSATANRPALQASGTRGNLFLNNEAVSTKGVAVSSYNYIKIIGNYLRDSNRGTQPRHDSTIESNVIDSCVKGIELGSYDGIIIKNNTIVNCTEGIDATNGNHHIIVNNILDGNITGADWDTEQTSNQFDYNCWDNTTDVSDATKGDNAVTGDPGLGFTLVAHSDGTTDAADETKFEDTTNSPFSGVDTGDALIIHSGTAVTTGVYTISAVVSNSELTISAGATTGGSSIVYGIVKGEDFTLGSGSNCLDAGSQVGTNTGATGDYKWNIGADQDDVAGGVATTSYGFIQ